MCPPPTPRLPTFPPLRLGHAPRVALTAAAAPRAQALEDLLTDLFIFGQGDDPLFLGGSASSPNPAISVHGSHFIPSAVEGNATIISFLTNSVSTSVSNIPVSASSGGQTFRFEGATPVRTSISAGPIYAERAQTLGRGRLFVNLSRTSLHYKTLRGVPLDNVQLVFTHANVDSPECDSIVGEDCAVYGVPVLENETINFTLGLDMNVDVTAFLLTYGIANRIDFGVVVPFVSTSLTGSSEATIIPFQSGDIPAHFFAGTPEDPVFTASRFTQGSSSGLGDVSARAKVNFRDATPVSVAILAEGRFPTGSEEDLRGSGAVALRGLGDRVGTIRRVLAPRQHRLPVPRCRARSRRVPADRGLRPAPRPLGYPGGGYHLGVPGGDH